MLIVIIIIPTALQPLVIMKVLYMEGLLLKNIKVIILITKKKNKNNHGTSLTLRPVLGVSKMNG